MKKNSNMLLRLLMFDILTVLITVGTQIFLFIKIKGELNDSAVVNALLTSYVGDGINYGLIIIFLINLVVSLFLFKIYSFKKKIFFSGLWTFLFTIFYLHYKINKIVTVLEEK